MCTPGYSRDIVLRLPTFIGPFANATGVDCSRNNTAFAVLAWATSLASLLLAVVIGTEVFRKRQPATSLRLGFFGMWMSLLNTIIFCIVGIYSPQGCFLAWAVFSFWVWFWSIAMVKYVLDGTIHVVRQVTRKSVTEILGGKVPFAIMIVVTVTCYLAVIVGSFGTAIRMFVFKDVTSAMVFWAIQCLGNACFIILGVTYNYVLFGRFADLVEQVTGDGDKLRQESHTTDGRPQSSAADDERRDIADLVYRFRYGRRTLLIPIPFGAGLWIAHAFVLPVFWYLAFAQIIVANIVPIFGIYNIYIPSSRKRQVGNRLTFGLLFRNDKAQSKMSSKDVRDDLAPKESDKQLAAAQDLEVSAYSGPVAPRTRSS